MVIEVLRLMYYGVGDAASMGAGVGYARRPQRWVVCLLLQHFRKAGSGEGPPLVDVDVGVEFLQWWLG